MQINTFIKRHLNLRIVGIFLIVFIIGYHANLTEDSFISFRVVDNAVHGFGLRWNIHERVQAYTNPLWVLIHIPFYAAFGDIFWVSTALSLICTFAALYLVMLIPLHHHWRFAALFLVPFAFSSTLMWHSATGLENPLNNLLFAALGWSLFIKDTRRRYFIVSLFATLAMVNRLDTALLYFPILAHLFTADKSSRKYIIMGSFPLACWLTFSLNYYGFLLPNTKYAKLPSNIPESAFIEQGLNYFLNLCAKDILSAGFLITAMLVLPLASFKRCASPSLCALSVGIIMYVLYIISVGGDHISGRLWSLPVFAALWLAYVLYSENMSAKWLAVFVLSISLLRIYYPPDSKLREWCSPCFAGDIQPEAIIKVNWQQYLNNPRIIEVRRGGMPPDIAVIKVIGLNGYTAGPYKTIVDQYALSDPLLSRLPSNTATIHKTGHMQRDIPFGYIHAIETGSTEMMTPHLAYYYDIIRSITQEPLYSSARWANILRFQLGFYDELVERHH